MVGIFMGVADEELGNIFVMMLCVRVGCLIVLRCEKMGRRDSQTEGADTGDLANRLHPHATIFKTPAYRSICVDHVHRFSLRLSFSKLSLRRGGVA
jgi:hypothetical protein